MDIVEESWKNKLRLCANYQMNPLSMGNINYMMTMLPQSVSLNQQTSDLNTGQYPKN